jgi:histidine triad (HIT) family protein
MSKPTDCIFCKIAAGQIPSRKVFEDDDLLVFHDINPSSPVHLLMIPKLHLENLYDADMKHQLLLGKMLGMTGELAKSLGCNDGFRLVINNGRVGRQEVYHLHAHLMSGSEPLRSGMKPPAV